MSLGDILVEEANSSGVSGVAKGRLERGLWVFSGKP